MDDALGIRVTTELTDALDSDTVAIAKNPANSHQFTIRNNRLEFININMEEADDSDEADDVSVSVHPTPSTAAATSADVTTRPVSATPKKRRKG